MARKSGPPRRTVEIFSPHPLVLQELERALAGRRFQPRARRVEISPAAPPALPSRALLYVVDAEVPRPTAAGVVAAIQNRFPGARILAVAERFPEKEALSLLGLGVKGLVRYEDVREKLPVALETVAHGGFWAPRALVSRFLDELSARPRLGRLTPESARLSARERQVLDLVLESLSNKEIGDRLHISERTVKFHVSNLLAKFRSTSRWELVVRCLPRPRSGRRDS